MSEKQTGEKHTSEKHLSDEQLAQLIYDCEDNGERDHLQTCRSCRKRYGELSAALDSARRLPVPELSAQERARMFEAAWQASELNQPERSSGLAWPILRHAVSFCAGLACGAALLLAIVSQSGAHGFLSAPQGEITRPKNPIPAMLSGTPAAKIYSELEDPVILIQESKEEDDSIQHRRVIEGTTENGAIQIVWNL
ncbi:MAG: hypothetical protein JXR73_21600 [Candidatus Omnitrophica bacterium]|nr:hypothetical protein [Candidatus Omnitrophota bacterium]